MIRQMPFFEILIFFLSSLSVCTLIYFKIPQGILQSFAALLLALAIVVSRIVFIKFKQQHGRLYRFLLLFLSALFVQLLVITTGGFLSPFVILLYLFTLAASFLFNLQSSISFLVFSALTLTVNIFFNSRMREIFWEDPWSTVLYFISFAVVVPLAQFLTRSYHIKDVLSKVLKEYIQISEKREGSILKSLSEFVVVTDKSLNIISTNEAVEKALSLSASEIIHHPFLEIIPLKDSAGSPVTMESLSVRDILNDQSARIIKGFSFQAKVDSRPRQMIIHAKPVTNPGGQVSQIVFIISEASFFDDTKRHDNLDAARKRYQMIFKTLGQSLLDAKLRRPAVQANLLAKIGEDLLIAQEIEDHPIRENIDFPDVAMIGQQAVASKQQFAQAMGVTLKFFLPPEEVGEAAWFSLKSSDLPEKTLPMSDFAVPVDGKWLGMALPRLLDLAILLSGGRNNPVVGLTARQENKTMVSMEIITSVPPLSGEQQKWLFEVNYGNLGETGYLYLGSGLEGFIARSILTQLNIPLKIDSTGLPPCLSFIMTFSKLRA